MVKNMAILEFGIKLSTNELFVYRWTYYINMPNKITVVSLNCIMNISFITNVHTFKNMRNSIRVGTLRRVVIIKHKLKCKLLLSFTHINTYKVVDVNICHFRIGCYHFDIYFHVKFCYVWHDLICCYWSRDQIGPIGRSFATARL